jgi:hypothetical protein
MADTYISLIKATKWVDLSDEHKQLRTSLENDIATTCCGKGYNQPIMLQGAFGIGKTTTLNYLFHYAWEVLKVPTFHILLSDLVEVVKKAALEQGVEKIQNELLAKIIKNVLDDQINKLKTEDWSTLTNLWFPDFTSMDEDVPLSLDDYLVDFAPVQIDADIDETTKNAFDKGFTKDVILDAINSSNKPLLLIDEFESRFTDLKNVVTSSGGGILRALFDQVVSSKPFYLIIGNGPGSAYEISKEQGTEDSTDNEAAGNRRLKPKQIPFPTIKLLQQKFMHNEPKGYVNFIWWVSRCRPGQIQRLHDSLNYDNCSQLDFSDFITKPIFSEPIDGTGNDAVKYLKTEYFNEIDSRLWKHMGEWLLNFEPCTYKINRDDREALMSCPDTFFVSEDLVEADKILVALQKDLSCYLKEKQDLGFYPRVDYLKNIHKYFTYVLSACSDKDGNVIFKTPNKRFEESFANAFAIPLFEIVYDLISQYEDDNDTGFKQTKDFVLDCIKWTEKAIENRDLNLKYNETFRLYEDSYCNLRPDSEVHIQFSLNAVRNMIEQPVGDPRLKYKDIALENLLNEIPMAKAGVVFAQKNNCRILFIPQFEEDRMSSYIVRVKQYVISNMPNLLHRGKDTMKIVFLGNYDDIDGLRKELLRDANDELSPIGKMSKLSIDTFDSYNFNFGSRTCDFIDSVVKITIIGAYKDEFTSLLSDGSYNIEDSIHKIGTSAWSTRKEDRRTIEHYSKLVLEGDNSTIDTIEKDAKSSFLNSMEQLICPIDRYNDYSNFELSTLFDETTQTYEPLSKFVCLLYIIEHAGKETISSSLLDFLRIVGQRSSRLYFEAKTEESSVHESYHLDEIYKILNDTERTSRLLKNVDIDSDFYKSLSAFTSMLVDESLRANLTHSFISFIRNDIANHWISEYNSVMSSYSSSEGDILMRLTYAIASAKLVDYEKLRKETAERLDSISQHIQEKRTQIIESLSDIKDYLFPIGTRRVGDPLAGYLQIIQSVLNLCRLIKKELVEDGTSLSTYLLLETISWRIENMKTSINTLCSQVVDLSKRLTQKREAIRTKFQVPIDDMLKDKLVSLLVNESDPIGNIKPPFDNDILWRKYAWKIGSLDKIKYILFDMNPSPKDAVGYFKFEDIESIKKSIESIYSEMVNNAFMPIQNLCSEKCDEIDSYQKMLTYVSNLINNVQDDTDR